MRQWPVEGEPGNAAGWLLAVARRRAADRVRREVTLRRKLPLLIARDPEDDPELATPLPDERLRLICTVRHPALAPAARVALTLR